ncbi:hypothetical protein GQ457_13G025430 [Hibiscus cannabinus]
MIYDENCLSLFLKLAFKEGEEKQHENIVRIGEEIVPKCKGVALAVETLGGLLCSTREERDWKVVRDSEIRGGSRNLNMGLGDKRGGGRRQMLRWSYDEVRSVLGSIRGLWRVYGVMVAVGCGGRWTVEICPQMNGSDALEIGSEHDTWRLTAGDRNPNWAYDVEKLNETLMVIQAVLLDAEEQQMHNREITFWLRKFKDACYQVEDMLDEVEIEALRRKVLERESIGRKVRYFLSSSTPLPFRFQIVQKIKEAKEMLDEIAINKSKFHLLEGRPPVKSVIHGERETYSFVKTSNVIGRDEDKENIVHFLMNPTDGEGEDVPVLPIVGIGGIGKTALAQLVFNDERVVKHFESRIWVCVAEDFDIKQLVVKTIKSATGAAQGSKIIVTTRTHKVATFTGTISHYDLEHLFDENCLSLFLKLAFKKGEEKQHKNLVRIGEEIVPKCKGVALAVETLGSLLCSTREERDWKVVRDSELWKLEQKENDILPALKLSYDHLPWYLKQCFAFCSVYPKDYEFNSLWLISLWMPNGLLQSSNTSEEPEDIGNRYIHELWSRSFFQQLEWDVIQFKFKMHDLVHDLALSVAQNEVSSYNHHSTGNVRHLWFYLSGHDASLSPNNMGHLRTLIFKSNEEGKADSKPLIAEYISKSKHLRVLECENLTYLFEDMQSLTALRTLIIDECKNLISLPQGLKYLTALETLVILDCEKLDLCMELELGEKEDGSLQKLVVEGLPNVKSLPQWFVLGSTKTLQELWISQLKNLLMFPTRFQNLTSLQKLEIEDCPKLAYLPEGMQHLTALKELTIEECPLLGERCMEETGEDWPKIAHIPHIHLINNS